MRLLNSLTNRIEELKPLNPTAVTLYTCGPTVYDYAHIGNLRTYIFEDILRRALRTSGHSVNHVMNITDIDDKTIARSQQEHPDQDPKIALKNLASHYLQLFLADAAAIGIDLSDSKLILATDEIKSMQELIQRIPNKYVSDDGVYFAIDKFKDYGQLVKLDQSHSHHRIKNDEYDKEHVADFALWKTQSNHEPAWDFEIEGQDVAGRPGWHIECSAIATKHLGQPFDLHTGGVDLKFPHHENEIAQAQAATGQPLAGLFVHAEHLLVDGAKMAKSKRNFYTLTDLTERGHHPLAFRLLVLQSHYRSQLNFTWESLEAAERFLLRLNNWADTQYQTVLAQISADQSENLIGEIDAALADDLDTPRAIARLSAFEALRPTQDLLIRLDQRLGLALSRRPNITEEQKRLIDDRQQGRSDGDFAGADKIRVELETQGILIDDTAAGAVWRRAVL